MVLSFLLFFFLYAVFIILNYLISLYNNKRLLILNKFYALVYEDTSLFLSGESFIRESIICFGFVGLFPLMSKNSVFCFV